MCWVLNVEDQPGATRCADHAHVEYQCVTGADVIYKDITYPYGSQGMPGLPELTCSEP